ncbi:methyl-accepting chemotaxis protein [Ferrimonas balearica]|uniref:methyl-accepting chemotaxis protein n=1 Tax=Ferrimonas balearica TaxID=44012 RepID=UPI001C956E39|nr:methyl-accepting chemotaxis protein [Ferrimonas balearica]MBY6224669.1 methyl-accepting chemotaxis protein [Ferrimonas balearica]
MRFSRWRVGSQISMLALGILTVVMMGLGTMAYQLSANALHQKAIQSVRSELDAMASLVDIQYRTQRQLAQHNAQVFADLFPGPFSLSGQSSSSSALRTPELFSNLEVMNGRDEEVDRFASLTDGNATIFVRSGDDFVRIASSLRKEDGSRATGTTLKTAHPAYQRLLAGQNYVGYATLFGRQLIAVYTPITDTENHVIGALYIGQDVTDVFSQLSATLAKIEFADSGYFSLLDKNNGQFLHHPLSQGETHSGDFKDDLGQPRYQKAMAVKEEDITRFTLRGETWLQSTAEVSGPNWVLVAEAPEQELVAALSTLQTFFICASVGAALLLGLSLIWVLKHTLNQPLDNLCQSIDAIGQGQLNLDLPHAPEDSKNEVHRIIASVGTMREGLYTLLQALNQSVEALEQAGNDLQGMAQRNSNGAADLKQQTELIATAMEEMSCTAREVAQHASQSADHSRQMDSTADIGDKEVHAVIRQMETLADSLNQGSTSIDRVARESQAIAKVVQVIDEIAEQTNLLALNAAIEAARAGDQGRGFAVVADEVRQLAKRTQHSTTEVNSTIEQLHSRTSDAVSQMNASLELGQRSSEQSNAAGAALQAITQGIGQLSASTNTIASAAEEQEAVAADIAANLSKISDLVRLSEDDAAQTVHAASELNQVANKLRTHLARFQL